MALNLDVVGEEFGPVDFVYDEDRVILYALGVGVGHNNLDLVYEKNLKALPTFAVIPGMPCVEPLMRKVNLNFETMLHIEKRLSLKGPIPVSGRIRTRGRVASIYDKGDRGAVISIKTESEDPEGNPLFETTTVLIDRSGGNFGGDRGPKVPKRAPPEGRVPDFRLTYPTSPEQALLYRLSGDKNPLHADPDFARNAGFDRPILMGLCTFGFSGRAILQEACGNDPARFKSFSARFSGYVFPGDTIITEGWKVAQGRYEVRTTNQAGRVVIDNAVAEVAEPAEP